jgi:hypothetical protein
LKLLPLTWLDFQKYFVDRTLCFSVYLLSQCMLGPFIHMTQRKYVTIIWWPIHGLSMLYRSWCRKITISEIFTGVLCTVGGTLVDSYLPWNWKRLNMALKLWLCAGAFVALTTHLVLSKSPE